MQDVIKGLFFSALYTACSAEELNNTRTFQPTSSPNMTLVDTTNTTGNFSIPCNTSSPTLMPTYRRKAPEGASPLSSYLVIATCCVLMINSALMVHTAYKRRQATQRRLAMLQDMTDILNRAAQIPPTNKFSMV